MRGAILMQEHRSSTYGQQTLGFKRADALWKIKFPHEPPPLDIPPEPPPPPQPPPPDTTLPRPNSPKAKLHPFAGSMCKRTFPLQNGLTRRLRYMHNATCPVPERKRPRADEPIPEESAFPCDKCDMIARSKTGLKAHIRAKHPENPKKDAPRPQLIPQPASLRCEFCLRDFGNIGGLACHKKFKHPPGTPILPATIQVTFPRNKKRQRDTSPPEREDREKVQCGACQKFYAHLDSLVIHCRKFHEGEGLPKKSNSTNGQYKTTKTRDLLALVCPTCGRQCV
ncbi:Tbingi protein [Trypanosoma theileri]|uniref:Tbingi protein n=1 Tax=Trypanosoma theileri TaxID=67003 RepID=A0A1X0NP84_9TRYP|nr:Tbingi protein [Trypanosoma theileri]ORC86328.1 Tbingi protein [Trypanosoma theileri]